LVEKVLCRDTNAFKAIIKNTEALVTQIIFKMIPGAEDRKDIVQDIYLKAFQKNWRALSSLFGNYDFLYRCQFFRLLLFS
jgi:DNA-directed RNA polymerase specialized sigma24 family protein